MRRAARLILTCLAVLAVTLMTAWAGLAVFWSDIANQTVRVVLAGLIPLPVLALFVFSRRKRIALAYFLAGFFALAAWWAAIPASNDRDWQTDVALAPSAQIDGDLVTARNVRDFEYVTETDYRPRYFDKTYDLRDLDSVDLIAVYWMGEPIAHVMMSFGFKGKDFLCLSIEIRKERGESYSTLAGLFKQYELIYLAGSERDLIGLRTNFRQPPEDVYLYRLNLPPENARKLFLEYMFEINNLKENPQFYNTLTTNCTTNVIRHFRAFGAAVRYNWKILLSGYAPLYAHEQGALDQRLPYEALRAASRVNDAARAAGEAPDFSQRIRRGLPGMPRSGP